MVSKAIANKICENVTCKGLYKQYYLLNLIFLLIKLFCSEMLFLFQEIKENRIFKEK